MAAIFKMAAIFPKLWLVFYQTLHTLYVFNEKVLKTAKISVLIQKQLKINFITVFSNGLLLMCSQLK